MSPQIITLIIVLAICVAAFILLYFQGKRNMKKRDEQQAAIDQAAQWVNMLIIDKKKLRMKQSGLPQQVIDQTPKFARLAKVPVVKAKVGPQIMVLIADNQIYDQIPVKKEVKALSAVFSFLMFAVSVDHWKNRRKRNSVSLHALPVRNNYPNMHEKTSVMNISHHAHFYLSQRSFNNPRYGSAVWCPHRMAE